MKRHTMGTDGRLARRLAAACLGAICLLGAGRLASAGGIEVADQGAAAMGRAGAFTVKADDLSAIYYNPAGLADIRGTNIFYSHRVVYSDTEYRRARTLDWTGATHGVPRLVDFEPVTNQKPWFPLGAMFAASSDFGLEDAAFALGVYGPPGIGYSKFPADGGQRYMLIEKDLMMLYYTLAGAWKYNDVFGVGLSLQWIHMPKLFLKMVTDGNVTARSVSPDTSRFDMITTIEGSDLFRFTAILGLWYRPIPSLEFAFAGRLIPWTNHVDCRLGVEPVQLNIEDDDVRILKNGVEDNRITMTMTQPVQLRGGIRYTYERAGREWFDIELDLFYEFWSQMDQFQITANVITEVMGTTVPIGTIDIPKGYRDTLAVRLGGDVIVLPGRLTLRAGAFYETPAVKNEYAYIDFISSHRFGPSAGLTVSVGGFDISAAYSYVVQSPIRVTEEESKIYQQVPGSPCVAPYTDPQLCHEKYLGQPSAVANAGVYLENYHLMSAGVNYRF